MKIKKMARISLGYILILVSFVASGFHQGVTASGPKMIPEENEITIEEGEELSIECQSDDKLRFWTETLSGNARFQQSNFTVSFDESSGTYTFVRPQTITADTGWYACARDDIVVENNHQTVERPEEEISWIYVYVHSSSKPFAVVQDYEIIPAVAGSRAVIPCRPTSPDLRVKLVINGDEISVPDDLPYDPKIGFILNNVMLWQNGENYMCKIDGDEDGDYSDYPLYSLTVSDTKAFENPVIDQDRLHHVVRGKDLTLECRITVPEDLSIFDMNWMAPDSVPKTRLWYDKKPTKVKDEPGRKRTWKLELTVKNVEDTDYGEYICTATGPGGAVNSSTSFKIWDPSYTYINVTMDSGRSSILLAEGQTAKWIIKIDAYPEELGFAWIKQDGTNVTNIGPDEASKYSYTQTGMRHIFRISNLDVNDNGNYTVHFRTSNDEAYFRLSLAVTAQPVTRIQRNSSTVLRGKTENFICVTSGSPLPNLTWSYIEYPDFPSKKNSEPVSLSDIQERRSNTDPFKFESYLNLTMDMTGDLICRTCNKINCTEVRETILVSDGLFGIFGPEEVTEGDNASLACSASRRNFTDKISWEFKKSESEFSETLPKNVRVTQSDTKSSYRLILEIRNASFSDAGVYSCKAECRMTGIRTEHRELVVMSAREPRITRTNLNNSQIVIKLKRNNRDKTLNCFVEGRPTPTVTWYKGDELLVDKDQYHFSSNNSTLQIKLFGDEDSGRYSCRAENRLGKVERYVEITVEGISRSHGTEIWISLICALIAIIVIVITYMGIKVRREKKLRKELLEAGLAHFREGAVESLNPDLTIDEQAELLPYDKRWEFPREQLKLGKQLGSGAFGVVMKAEARGICEEGEVTTVAVKMVRRTAEPSYMKALSSELKIMIHLGRHLNVVNLLGACTKTILTKRELYVIVEYCHFGNLHNYLQRHRDSFIDQIDPCTKKIDPRIGLERIEERTSIGSQNKLKNAALSLVSSVSGKSSSGNSNIELVDYRSGTGFGDVSMSPDGGVLSNNSVQPGWRSNYRGDYKDQNLKPICTQDLLCWAWQVSRGMEYLSARNVLHGDLAARNILLADDNIVKICDFGLAKNMYKDSNYKKKGDGPLPIKWMAIESIRDRIFSTQSDVWSFGIVLWEFFTLARSPYPGMEAEKQYDRLIEGYRMEKPEYATDEIYDLMLSSWRESPSTRPSFSELAEKIGTLLSEQIKIHYAELSAPYVNMNIVASQNGQSDYLTMMSAPNHTYCNSPVAVTAEVHPESNYVPMNRVKPSSQVGVSTSRQKPEESHFIFPDSSNQHTIPNDSDFENSNESDAMLKPQDAHAKPVDVHQELKNKSANYSNIVASNERDSGYRNIPHSSRLNHQQSVEQSENIKNMNRNRNEVQWEANETKELIPPEINAANNRVHNIPQQKADSYSNPSYVLMSGNKNKSSKRDE